LERKRNEAMQLEIQAIEKNNKEEEEERQRQRFQLLELRRLKRMQDSHSRREKGEQLEKEEMKKKSLASSAKPLYIRMAKKYQEKEESLFPKRRPALNSPNTSINSQSPQKYHSKNMVVFKILEDLIPSRKYLQKKCSTLELKAKWIRKMQKKSFKKKLNMLHWFVKCSLQQLTKINEKRYSYSSRISTNK
jgi:DNA gyrase/topoisomerase IV subunit A